MELWYSIVELLPFSWAAEGSMYFMKNALLALLVVSPLFGILSTMVVTRRMSFFSDALGHSAFTGVAVGSICGLAEPLWGAVVVRRSAGPAVHRRPAADQPGQRHGDWRVLLHRRGSWHLHRHLRGRLLHQVQLLPHRRYPVGDLWKDRRPGSDLIGSPPAVGAFPTTS